MIIIDLQQVMIANLSQQLGNHVNAQLDENMLRHMVLNSIRSLRKKYANDGDMIIACDSKHSWRKGVFPFYKANRATNRANSELDWNLIFRSFDVIKAELKEFFPYRVIGVDGAEADDIIGVLAHTFGADCEEFCGMNIGANEPITILSGDHDFRQLHVYKNVSQFDPSRKKKVIEGNPELYLKEHIIRGDAGDGVPNFLSADDSFVMKTRQKSIMETSLKIWLNQSVEEICDTPEKKKNWIRNETMIDLRHTPENIRNEILTQYVEQADKGKTQLVNYFISRRLKHLHEFINDF